MNIITVFRQALTNARCLPKSAFCARKVAPLLERQSEALFTNCWLVALSYSRSVVSLSVIFSKEYQKEKLYCAEASSGFGQ